MFETIENNEEIIKASVKLIWMATNGKVVNIIFDDPILLAKVVLDNDTSRIIILNEPEAVLLNKNNYIKIRNKLAGKSSITINEVEIDNEENREPTQEFRLIEDTMKNQLSDSRLDASNITSQEPNMESSFKMFKRDSTIDNKRTEFSQDEYSNMDEEIDELIFDALATSCEKRKEVVSYKSNSTRIKSQSKTNDSFKVTKEFRKSSNKNTDDTLDRVSSDLTNDSLPSINEVLGQLFVAKIVKNINEKANISQNSNDLKLALSSKDDVPGVQKTTTQVEDDGEEISKIISNSQNQPIVIIDDPIPVNSIIDRVPALYINKGKRKIEPDMKEKKSKKLKSYVLNNSEGSSLSSIEEVFLVTNNQQEDILNKSNSSTTIRESSNSNDSDFSELDYDTNL
ncbi:31481_t:CDS:10, partial [Gigaspora margarita]